MALKLDDAVIAVARLIGAIPGLRGSPNEPPEKIISFPFAITFPMAGEWDLLGPNYSKGLHTIGIEIHTARKDLPRDIAAVLPFGELVAGILLTPANIRLPDAAGNPTCSTIIYPLRYTFGPLGYVNIPTVGWSFELDIKIE